MHYKLPNFKGILGCKELLNLLIAYKNMVLEFFGQVFLPKLANWGNPHVLLRGQGAFFVYIQARHGRRARFCRPREGECKTGQGRKRFLATWVQQHGVSFFLDTFAWTSKKKYLDRPGETGLKNAARRSRIKYTLILTFSRR